MDYYNARASIKHAGDQIGFIRVGFFMNEPTNKDGSLSKGQIEKLDATMKFVKMVGESEQFLVGDLIQSNCAALKNRNCCRKIHASFDL